MSPAAVQSSLFGTVFAFTRVLQSSLGDQTASLQYNLEGFGSDDDSTGKKDDVRDAQQAYSGLGLLGRPPEERDKEDPDLLAEALGARDGDGGVVPFAYRDARILKWLNRGSSEPSTPKKGQIMLAGYGGAFLAFDYLSGANGPTNIATLYVPFDRGGDGVPRKAHMIAVDTTPGNEALSLVHASGLALLMTEADGIVLRGDEKTRLVIKPGKIEATAGSIALSGIVALGANTAAALPLLPGLATQPTPSVFFSAT
jgi:hypothetical protein